MSCFISDDSTLPPLPLLPLFTQLGVPDGSSRSSNEQAWYVITWIHEGDRIPGESLFPAVRRGEKGQLPELMLRFFLPSLVIQILSNFLLPFFFYLLPCFQNAKRSPLHRFFRLFLRSFPSFHLNNDVIEFGNVLCCFPFVLFCLEQFRIYAKEKNNKTRKTSLLLPLYLFSSYLFPPRLFTINYQVFYRLYSPFVYPLLIAVYLL